MTNTTPVVTTTPIVQLYVPAIRPDWYGVYVNNRLVSKGQIDQMNTLEGQFFGRYWRIPR